MDSEKIAGSIASLEKGAENTDRFLDRLERGLDLVEKEIKDLKSNSIAVEKQYEGMFSELQHKLNETQEVKDKLRQLAGRVKEKESRLNESLVKLKNRISTFENNCDAHKEKTKEKTAWYIIKNETGLALRIVWAFFMFFICGAIIGWDKLVIWGLSLLK